jgi:hypothetical protein
MDDRTVRVALERHWDASDANEFTVEHEIYHEDAVLAPTARPTAGIMSRFRLSSLEPRPDEGRVLVSGPPVRHTLYCCCKK